MIEHEELCLGHVLEAKPIPHTRTAWGIWYSSPCCSGRWLRYRYRAGSGDIWMAKEKALQFIDNKLNS